MDGPLPTWRSVLLPNDSLCREVAVIHTPGCISLSKEGLLSVVIDGENYPYLPFMEIVVSAFVVWRLASLAVVYLKACMGSIPRPGSWRVASLFLQPPFLPGREMGD